MLALAFELPPVSGGEEAVGFDFFLTTTPFNDFLRSFFAGAADTLLLAGAGCGGGALDAVPTIGLLAAVSRAATALRMVKIGISLVQN